MINSELNATENRDAFDAFLNKAKGNFSGGDTGLWTRIIQSEDRNELLSIMDRLTASFSFEAEAIFIENGHAFEITLPRIIN